MAAKKSPRPIHPDALLLSFPQVAVVLGVSVSTLRKIRDRGGFPAPAPIGSSQRPKYHRDDINAYAAGKVESR